MDSLRIVCAVDADIAASVRSSKPRSSRAHYDASVVEALRRVYRSVEVIGITEASLTGLNRVATSRPDVVFNLAQSALPGEAAFAGCLDWLGVPYTGSGPTGITCSRHKVLARELLKEAGVPVPKSVELALGNHGRIDFEPPYIIKPAFGASSSGIHADSVLRQASGHKRLARRIWREQGVSAICEEFIVGRELRVGLIEEVGGFKIAGISEWSFGSADPGWGFKTYSIRSNPRVRRAQMVERSEARLSRDLLTSVREVSRRAVQKLNVRGYATLDLRIDASDRIVVIEVNCNPGLSASSGIWNRPSFEQTLRRIVKAAQIVARERA